MICRHLEKQFLQFIFLFICSLQKKHVWARTLETGCASNKKDKSAFVQIPCPDCISRCLELLTYLRDSNWYVKNNIFCFSCSDIFLAKIVFRPVPLNHMEIFQESSQTALFCWGDEWQTREKHCWSFWLPALQKYYLKCRWYQTIPKFIN